MNKNSDTDNDDPTPVADRLPFPTDEDLEIALSERNLDWCREFMESSSLGEILIIQGGIRLQTISNETVRCIGIVDHPQSWDLLLKLYATFCALDVSMQLDPYAVIIPYIEPEEEELEAKEEIADWMWS